MKPYPCIVEGSDRRLNFRINNSILFQDSYECADQSFIISDYYWIKTNSLFKEIEGFKISEYVVLETNSIFDTLEKDMSYYLSPQSMSSFFSRDPHRH